MAMKIFDVIFSIVRGKVNGDM